MDLHRELAGGCHDDARIEVGLRSPSPDAEQRLVQRHEERGRLAGPVCAWPATSRPASAIAASAPGWACTV